MRLSACCPAGGSVTLFVYRSARVFASPTAVSGRDRANAARLPKHARRFVTALFLLLAFAAVGCTGSSDPQFSDSPAPSRPSATRLEDVPGPGGDAALPRSLARSIDTRLGGLATALAVQREPVAGQPAEPAPVRLTELSGDDAAAQTGARLISVVRTLADRLAEAESQFISPARAAEVVPLSVHAPPAAGEEVMTTDARSGAVTGDPIAQSQPPSISVRQGGADAGVPEPTPPPDKAPPATATTPVIAEPPGRYDRLDPHPEAEQEATPPLEPDTGASDRQNSRTSETWTTEHGASDPEFGPGRESMPDRKPGRDRPRPTSSPPGLAEPPHTRAADMPTREGGQQLHGDFDASPSTEIGRRRSNSRSCIEHNRVSVSPTRGGGATAPAAPQPLRQPAKERKCSSIE